MPCPRRRPRMPREQVVAGNFSPRGTIFPTTGMKLLSRLVSSWNDIFSYSFNCRSYSVTTILYSVLHCRGVSDAQCFKVIVETIRSYKWLWLNSLTTVEPNDILYSFESSFKNLYFQMDIGKLVLHFPYLDLEMLTNRVSLHVSAFWFRCNSLADELTN